MRLLLSALLLAACGAHRVAVAPAPSATTGDAFEVPPDAVGWYLRAIAAEELGELDEARRALAWVVRLDRGSPWSWMAQGALAERQGDLQDALAAYVQAESRAALPEVSLAIAGVHLKTRDFEAATPQLQSAWDGGLHQEALERLSAAISLNNLNCEAQAVLDWALGEGLDRRGEDWARLLAEPVAALEGCVTGDSR